MTLRAKDADPVGLVGRMFGELQGNVAALVSALQMIEQGHVYRGSVRHELDAESMQIIAREALGALRREVTR